jgi:hypothetical protein
MGNKNSRGSQESIITEDNFSLNSMNYLSDKLSLLEKNKETLADEISGHLKWLLSGKNIYNSSNEKFKEDLYICIKYILNSSIDEYKLDFDINILFELACSNNYPTNIVSLFIERGCDISRGIIVSEENHNLEIQEWLVKQLEDKQKKFSLNLKLRKTGLQIGNNLINKISGPVSITILKPKETHSSQPIMILFGDKHVKESPCDPCFNEDGCFNIYDEKFLEILNSISSKPEHIIDIYTETPISQKQFKNIDGDYRCDFYKKTQYCYNFKTPSIYDRCKYKNIRFHHSDARSNENKKKKDKEYLEEFVVQNVVGLNKFLSNIENNWEQIINKEKITTIDIFNHTEDEIQKITTKLFKNQIIFGYLEKFTQEIFSKLSEKPDDRSSYILKQIKNNMYKLNWELLYLDSLKYDINSINACLYYLYNLNDKEGEEASKMQNEQIYYLHTLLFSPLLDIYFLSRNFKISKHIIKPALVIGYFGDWHCKNISQLLKKYMNYQNFYTERKNSSLKQCIDFNDVYIELKLSETKTGHEDLNIRLRKMRGYTVDGSKNKKKSRKKKSSKKKSIKKKQSKKKKDAFRK